VIDTARWDVPAMRSGAAVCLVFAVPFSIGARLAADHDNSSLAVLLSLGAVAGFLIGAGCAAWLQRRRTPLSHGIVTAGVTYLAAQAVFVAVRLARSQPVGRVGGARVQPHRRRRRRPRRRVDRPATAGQGVRPVVAAGRSGERLVGRVAPLKLVRRPPTGKARARRTPDPRRSVRPL